MNHKRNAKKEFLEITKSYKVIAASITFGDDYTDSDSFKLKPLYNKDEWNEFMNFLNRYYDSGYGSQNLHGFIFCEDNVWMSRGEYDGSEWWDINQYPNLREYFDEKDVLKYERKSKIKKIEQ